MESTSSNTDVFEDIEPYYQPASTGARFANYVIDMLLYYVVFYACMFLLGVILAASGSTFDVAASLRTTEGQAVLYLFAFALIVIYFTLIEGLSKGRSIGKLITGTVAVQEDSSPITWKDALLRSLCRIIPFEPLSGFSGNPWHDSMTHTMVIRKTKAY